MKALCASRLFDGTALLHDHVVLFDGARIAAVVPRHAVPPGAERTDLPEDHVLAPGFVDLQVNGGGGVLFNDTPDTATLRRIAAAHATAGTTTMLPTLISGTRGQLRAALAAARAALADGRAGRRRAAPRRPVHRRLPPRHPSGRSDHHHDRRRSGAAVRGFSRRLCWSPSPPKRCRPSTSAAWPAQARPSSPATPTPPTTRPSPDSPPASRGSRISTTRCPASCRARPAPSAPRSTAPTPSPASSSTATTCMPPSVRIAFAAKGPDALLLVSDAMATAASDRTSFTLNGEPIRPARRQAGKRRRHAGRRAPDHGGRRAQRGPPSPACRSKRRCAWPRTRRPRHRLRRSRPHRTGLPRRFCRARRRSARHRVWQLGVRSSRGVAPDPPGALPLDPTKGQWPLEPNPIASLG